jgi:hypothetical protein
MTRALVGGPRLTVTPQPLTRSHDGTRARAQSSRFRETDLGWGNSRDSGVARALEVEVTSVRVPRRGCEGSLRSHDARILRLDAPMRVHDATANALDGSALCIPAKDISDRGDSMAQRIEEILHRSRTSYTVSRKELGEWREWFSGGAKAHRAGRTAHRVARTAHRGAAIAHRVEQITYRSSTRHVRRRSSHVSAPASDLS